MDNCVTNRQLLADSYIVSPIENFPVSVINYDKMEMAQFIHSGQLTNSTPVIQLTDLNSNLKTKVLHPLEIEIQRDFVLKQQHQQVVGKHSTASVIQCTGQSATSEISPKHLETSALLDGVMELHAVPTERETVLNVNPSKPSENMICHISQVSAPLAIEKRQYIIVSDNSMLFNVPSMENKFEQKQLNCDIVTNECLTKPEMQDLSMILGNVSEKRVENKKNVIESDSENDEDEVEPVYDHEPDPDMSVKLSSEQVEKPNKCYMCFRCFRQKKNMYAHIRKIHSMQPKIEGGILCPLCKMHALRQEHLRNHLETLHDIPIEKEEKLFNTIEDFLSWKEFIERETLSFYVSKSSSKLLANNQQKTYYKCHRSGNYCSQKKENRKKKLKVQGSNKIGATCPAAMEVTENTNGINVIFWKTHVGHDNDLSHLVLSKEDKSKIMDYIVSGVSWDNIIEKIKKDESNNSLTPSRLTIVSKQDLRNVKKIHDMKSNSEFYATRKKIVQGRKPVKEKMLRRASQSLVVEKADMLLNLLETTDVRPEFRPKICLMIDNLISTVKRRAIKLPKRENQKRKQWMRCESLEHEESKEHPDGKAAKMSESSEQKSEDFANNFEKNSARKSNSIKSTSTRHSHRESGQKKPLDIRR